MAISEVEKCTSETLALLALDGGHDDDDDDDNDATIFPSLSQDLRDLLMNPSRLEKEETCNSLNLLIQFLWKELKDTNLVR